jgi:hypothetical protein
MRPVFLALALALTLPVACYRDSPRPPQAGPIKRPQTEGECHACNGTWGPHGLSQKESCLCRTRDFGKVCKDGLECEGECVAVDGQTEVTDPGPPARGYFLGKCSEFDMVYGCNKLLMDGTKPHGPVRLDEPLTEMCVD